MPRALIAITLQAVILAFAWMTGVERKAAVAT
jgi:hypothetical protein